MQIQGPDARVLGRILAAQSVVFALPDAAHIAEFYAQTLLEIPGVSGSLVCVGGSPVQAGEMEHGACAECEVARRQGEDPPARTVDAAHGCRLAGRPDVRLVAIESFTHHFGVFAIRASDPALVEVYGPFISNLSNDVAMTLENRRQRDLLERAHADLERRIENRTRELRLANEDLRHEAGERLKAERALRESEETFRTFVEESSEAFSLTDEQGVIIEFNEASERMTGMPAARAIGRYPWDVLLDLLPPGDRTPERRERERATAVAALEGRQPGPIDLVVEIARTRPGEASAFLLFTVFPIRTERGRRLGVVTRDITARLRAEEEIRRFNQELEARVVERTAQLEAANRELESFAYSVSHDLRAPLRHIDGFLELLKARAGATLDEQSRRYMAQVSEAAHRMATLIDGLLAFSRMGRHTLKKSPVDLGGLLREVIHDLAPDARGRSVHWDVASLPVVSGDRTLLRVVLVNLLANALKFTRPRESARIAIGCARDDHGTAFFVQDNGVGFDARYADKLFGVFQRLHHADEFEGTGIGLATVRRIVERHGGRAWATGRVDGGATFWFSLPQAGTK